MPVPHVFQDYATEPCHATLITNAIIAFSFQLIFSLPSPSLDEATARRLGALPNLQAKEPHHRVTNVYILLTLVCLVISLLVYVISELAIYRLST